MMQGTVGIQSGNSSHCDYLVRVSLLSKLPGIVHKEYDLRFRTRETLASRESWDAAHTWMRRPLRRMAGALAAVIGASMISDIVFDLSEVVEVAMIATQLTILIGGLLLIGWRAHRVAAEVNRQAAAPKVPANSPRA
ncbi:hypothetical protein [Nonomuraea sp. NPDC048916]|uniref:hypothetical protein n=1 Tax=Nonomuraea sp. NPDC048916 TaxID=3154232 RepID=UPI003409CB53